MNNTKNTDDVQAAPPQGEPPGEGIHQIIDIHIYTALPPGEETPSIESTLAEPSAGTPPPAWERVEAKDAGTRKRLLMLGIPPFLLALVAMLIVGLVYILFFQSVVTVTIIPDSREIQANGMITVVGGRAVISQNQIPGRVLPEVTMSQTWQQATTGTTEEPARPGRGTITFYNAALYPQIVAAGTLITGKDSVQVVTDYTVSVPAGTLATNGEATVTAHSVVPGTSGNILADDIYGDCCLLKISAENHAFTGGRAAATYQSVSQNDIDQAKARLKTSLMQAVTAALQTQVQSSETLVTPPTCQPTVSTDKEPGEKAVQVQVTISLSCTGVTYETAPFERLMEQMQTQAAGKELRAHSHLVGSVHAAIQTVTDGATSDVARLSVQTTGTWVYQFGASELHHLAVQIAGMDTRQAGRLLLRTPGVRHVSWSQGGTLPTDPGRIHFLFVS